MRLTILILVFAATVAYQANATKPQIYESGVALRYSTIIKDGEVIPIVLKEDEDLPPDAPRTVIPFFAERINNNVYIGCLDNLGTVTVELYSTAGDWVNVPFDTSTGSILLPISGLSGSYTITITTFGGVVFFGEFVI